MSSYAERHLIYRIANADVRPYPYPHFYIEDVFPAQFYKRILDCFPCSEAMPQLKALRGLSVYPEQRLCVPLLPDSLDKLPEKEREFWDGVAQWLLGHRFFNALIERFKPLLAERFQTLDDVSFMTEALLVDDRTQFWLGPHSDSRKKVLTLLFYLPDDLAQEHLGTSIYAPRDPNFRCLGGPHYAYEEFDRIYTAPFRPNSLFGFVKTANSFHGVEPLTENESSRRRLLLYDINVPDAFALGTHPSPASQSAPTTKPGIRFSF